MKYKIDNENLTLKRLDKFLTDQLSLSRSQIQKLIDQELVLVNSKKVKNNYLLKINDEIEVLEGKQEPSHLEKENIVLDIVYEDDDVLVVNKPSGLVVHPAPGNHSGTLVNALMYHCNNDLSTINGEIRPGIVHRIDADTSGLLLVAKNDAAHLSLASQIQNKTVSRKYLALVQGVIKEDTATIDAPIGRDKNDRKKMTVTDVNAKEAVTHIKVLERYPHATLIECTLETGRTHQIRVHMKYIGHPVVNDPVYGYKNLDNKEFGQMLHAYLIGFKHPKTGAYLEFKQEPPKEFMTILSEYQK